VAQKIIAERWRLLQGAILRNRISPLYADDADAFLQPTMSSLLEGDSEKQRGGAQL
jgi:hypothetical protein